MKVLSSIIVGISLILFSPYGSTSETLQRETIVAKPGDANTSHSLPFSADYPVAQFSADTTSGDISLTVHFTDLSTGVVDHWEWDLDGDGKLDSYEQNPVFTYEKQGTYTVSLYVSGPFGEDKIIKQSYIEAHIGEGQPGTIKWSVEVGTTRSSPAIDDNGVIYIGSWSNKCLYAINSDGSIKWTFNTDGEIIEASPAIDGDTIYIPSRDGYLYAIHMDGTLKWKLLLHEGVYSNNIPAIGQDGTIYVSAERYLFAVNPSGDVKWGRSWGYYANPVADSSGAVYVTEYNSSTSSAFVAYDQDGLEIWRTSCPPYVVCSLPNWRSPTLSENHILFPLDSGLAALNYEGTIEWWARAETVCEGETPPCYRRIQRVESAVVGNGMIYIATNDGYVYAISSENGLALWQFHPGISGGIYGVPCIGDDGTIYVLYYTEADGIKGRLYAIDSKGTEKWHCALGLMNSNSSSPVIHANTLYVGVDFSYRLYAVNVASTSLAQSDWPCIHRDLKHSGRYTHLPPVAEFSADIRLGKAPLFVPFTENSTGNVLSKFWDFGDGSTGDLHPWHTYMKAGTYTVTRTVAGLGGSNTMTRTDYITVKEPAPVPDFEGKPTQGTVPLKVEFTDKSTNEATSWLWNFGDGKTSTEQHPRKTYTAAGSYTVSLTVTGPGGSATKKLTNYIKVNGPAPKASFIGTPTEGKAPLTVKFTDKSLNKVTNWLWNFGDGESSTRQNPSHIYTKAGTYSVSLTVEGSGGSSTADKENYIVAVDPAPKAEFTGIPNRGKSPLKVNFTDQSTGKVTKWSWSFGDGGTSRVKDPVHTFRKAGVYAVKLSVSGPGGTNTKTKVKYITATK